MSQAVQVADFVKRDRLEVEAARLARGGRRPRERGIEEDVGLEQLAGEVVDEQARRRQHAVEFRRRQKPDRRPAVVLARHR